MNALELCMLASGIEEVRDAKLVVVGERFDDRDRGVFAQVGASDLLLRDSSLGDAVVLLVRAAIDRPRPTGGRPRRVTG